MGSVVIWDTGQVGPISTTSDLCFGCVVLESQPGHQLFFHGFPQYLQKSGWIKDIAIPVTGHGGP
jgi:hypothetical protein